MVDLALDRSQSTELMVIYGFLVSTNGIIDQFAF